MNLGMAFLFVSCFKGFEFDGKIDAEGKALLSSFDLQGQRNLQAPERRDSGLAAGNNPDTLPGMGDFFLHYGGGFDLRPFFQFEGEVRFLFFNHFPHLRWAYRLFLLLGFFNL